MEHVKEGGPNADNNGIRAKKERQLSHRAELAQGGACAGGDGAGNADGQVLADTGNGAKNAEAQTRPEAAAQTDKEKILQLIERLPSCPMRSWAALPCEWAVYFILHNGACIYVGASQNLYSRWKTHEIRRSLESKGFSLDALRIAWTSLHVADQEEPDHTSYTNLMAVESFVINALRPELNSLKTLRSPLLLSYEFNVGHVQIFATSKLPALPAPKPTKKATKPKK